MRGVIPHSTKEEQSLVFACLDVGLNELIRLANIREFYQRLGRNPEHRSRLGRQSSFHQNDCSLYITNEFDGKSNSKNVLAISVVGLNKKFLFMAEPVDLIENFKIFGVTRSDLL
jgi:hypothetical protein